MKKYGILPDSFDLAKDPIDIYKTDQRYWESLWYYPPDLEKPLLYDNPYPETCRSNTPVDKTVLRHIVLYVLTMELKKFGNLTGRGILSGSMMQDHVLM